MAELLESAVDPDPLEQFRRWYADAEGAEIRAPQAMALATSTADGAPSVRMVLLKGADERGFVFFTGYVSRKAGELDANPRAALLFHWDPLGRQVRVEGHVEHVAGQESDAYFATRPRGAQLAAAASQQSSVLSRSCGDRHARRRTRPRARRQRRAAARSLGRLSPRAGGLRVLAAPRRPPARSPALPARERRLGRRAALAL